MNTPWRLLETPPATAAWNMTLDAVLLEGRGRRARDPSPPTVRLMSFSPPAVLIGAYQSLESEVRLDFCRERGLGVNRRITGGGAIFFDESQIGWEVICRFDDLGGPSRPSEELFRFLSSPVVHALRELGLDAAYRPRNDIEIEGRKIAGTGGTDLHGALLFQGTLLVDFDVETMVRALRVPVEKLRRQELEGMRDRVTWLARELPVLPPHQELKALLARHFEQRLGIDLRPGPLTEAETCALEARLDQFSSDQWIRGRGRLGGEVGKAIYPTDGGVVRVVLRSERGGRRIRAVTIDGDFFAFPKRAIYDIEAWLKGASAARVPELVREIFEHRVIDLPGVGPEGITAAILEALDRARGPRLGMEPRQLNSVFPVRGALEEVAALTPSHLLLPYCAKPPDCEWRRLDGCDECGECTVGDAYRAGAAAGLEVRSITSFEHLMQTLRELRSEGARAYLGSCCEAFYVKHRRDLEALELPGLLFDVASDETCYDLGKSSYAYRGEFEGESSLDLELMASLIRACAPMSCRASDETRR
jgi:lipoate-protein ligase A